MMRKLFAIIVAVILLILSVCIFCTAKDTSELSVPVCAAQSKDICEKFPVPCTPRPENAVLFSEQDPGLVRVATEYYNNFLVAEPEIFLMSQKGQTYIKYTGLDEPATEEEYEYVKNKALEITEDCKTNAEKIRAVAEFAAKNVYFDYDYTPDGDKPYTSLALTPYAVLTQKNTVCEGYARVCEALLQAVGVPCVYVLSPNHAWNMAYDGEEWILFDSTWMSNCKYENGKFTTSKKINSEWYGFTLKTALGDYNHLITELPLMISGRTLTRYPGYPMTNEILIPDGVSTIATRVFYSDSFLDCTSIVIPESLEWASESLFSSQCKIESVHIESLKAWLGIWFVSYWSNPMFNGADLYLNGTKITELTIPDSCSRIEKYAFYGCTSIENVTLPDSVKSIGERAFAYCENLANIYLPEALKEIGTGAFISCESLESAVIPDGVTTVDRYTFCGCSSLKNVTLPESLKTVEDYAFVHCVSLDAITIPDGTEYIGWDAFSNCKNLTSVILPDSVTYVGDYAFSECTKLQSIVFSKNLTDIGYSLLNGCTSLESIDIPDNINSIGASAFYGCTNLNGVKLGNGIDSIAAFAFGECTNLKNIIIPQGVESLGNSAFLNCTKLESIYIPETVTGIGKSAFEGCASLTEIKLPDGITAISDSLFSGCSSLEKADLSKGLTRIGSSAFLGCHSMPAIEIPSTVESIGDRAFYNCIKLESIKIPEALKAIEDYTFYGCSSLTSVEVPKSVEAIGRSVFSNCTGLSGITLPYGLKAIDTKTFNGCTSLTSITIPESVETIGNNAFDGCTGLISVTIPKSVTSLGSRAFNGCTGLVSVTLPDSLTQIAKYTFNYCIKLESITLPDSITEISDGAFAKCEKLSTVNYTSDKTEWDKITIGESNEMLTNAVLNTECIGLVSDTLRISTADINGISADIIVNFKAETTVGELCKSTICGEGTEIKLYSKDGIELSDEEYITSGCVLEYTRSNGSVRLSIYDGGDADGNGEISFDDIRSIMLYVAGAKNGILIPAADFNFDGAVTAADLNMFIAMLAK